MGSNYNEEKQNISEIIIYDKEMPSQIKNNPSQKKMKNMKSSNDIHLFMDTHISDFTVLICYDATVFFPNFNLAAQFLYEFYYMHCIQ